MPIAPLNSDILKSIWNIPCSNTVTTFTEGFFIYLWVDYKKEHCDLIVWATCWKSHWQLKDTGELPLFSGWFTGTLNLDITNSTWNIFFPTPSPHIWKNYVLMTHILSISWWKPSITAHLISFGPGPACKQTEQGILACAFIEFICARFRLCHSIRHCLHEY